MTKMETVLAEVQVPITIAIAIAIAIAITIIVMTTVELPWFSLEDVQQKVLSARRESEKPQIKLFRRSSIAEIECEDYESKSDNDTDD